MPQLKVNRNAAYIIEHFVLIAVVCLGGLALLLGAIHSAPNAEEFELSSGPRDIGVIRFLANLFIRYDGRYSTNLLHAFNPLSINWIAGYKLLPIIATSLLVLSMKYIFDSLFEATQKHTILLLAMLSSFVMMGAVPSLPYTLYWAGASFVYLYPCIFSLFFIGSLVRYIRSCSSSANMKYFFLSSIALFFGVGFNEMFLPFYGLLLSGLFLYYFFFDKSVLRQLMPIIMVGVMSILFFIAAPGVSARLSDSDKPFSIKILTNNMVNLIDTLSSEFSLPIVIFLLLYVCYLAVSKQLVLRFDLKKKHLIIIITTMVALPFLMAIAYYYPKQSMYGYPERIYAPTIFIFLMLQLIFVVGASKLFAHKIEQVKVSQLKWVGVIVLLFLGLDLVVGENNIALLYQDFRTGKLSHFKQFTDERFAQLALASQNNDEYTFITVPKLDDNYPTSIYTYPDEETNRANSIWNKYHEEYFKLNTIMVAGDTTQKFD